jgi:hypothetical protein
MADAARQAAVAEIDPERAAAARGILVEACAALAAAHQAGPTSEMLVGWIGAVLADVARDPKLRHDLALRDLFCCARTLVKAEREFGEALGQAPGQPFPAEVSRAVLDARLRLGCAVRGVFAARLQTGAERYVAAGGRL